jgi:hypothetical protein
MQQARVLVLSWQGAKYKQKLAIREGFINSTGSLNSTFHPNLIQQFYQSALNSRLSFMILRSLDFL